MNLEAVPEPSANLPRRRLATAALTVAVALAVAANATIPPMFRGVNDDAIYFAIFAAGAMVGEACLLAVWSALGAQVIWLRMPITLALLVVGACSYVVGLRQLEPSVPTTATVIFIAFGVAIFAAVQLPLVVARAVTPQRIDWQDAGPLSQQRESSQFGLRYLMGCTAGAAVLITIVRQALPPGEFDRGIISDVHEIALMMAMLAGISALICLPCVYLALGSVRAPYLIWLITVLLAGPVSLIAIIEATLGSTPDFTEFVFGAHCGSLGMAGTILAVLFVARWLGLRLQ